MSRYRALSVEDIGPDGQYLYKNSASQPPLAGGNATDTIAAAQHTANTSIHTKTADLIDAFRQTSIQQHDTVAENASLQAAAPLPIPTSDASVQRSIYKSDDIVDELLARSQYKQTTTQHAQPAIPPLPVSGIS
jgi:hypothetical protein